MNEVYVRVCVWKVWSTQDVIAKGLLTCSVSVPFTPAAALFFSIKDLWRGVLVFIWVIEDVAVDLCVLAQFQSPSNRSEV